ncbi:Bardet-Biedl syndrome 12 protein [Phyllostomus hastatus]|uniref:Bardet-Biedl syndrome 12 protein n=1 Tax=Phyllostomus hastatus TaxID=9423 RepID=UPI001E683909|nr:Bardet-Biedl syndrome 12 protein [Phyllostomus hastatus]XP_045687838.1 Bardet-Biedl syndrome 12 protein [Phyllostomus hastatus]XP_045687839.1 Bardet-Biedl syndrome 12 protein [Phyllostomus hastatus]
MARRGVSRRRHVGLQQLASFAHAGSTLLGPVKSPKFVVDGEGSESVLVSSTVRLLERLDLTSAVGQLLGEAVRAQNDAYGTGASTLLSLAGAWSTAAAECLHLGVPMPAIVSGMSEGLAACMEEVVALQVPLHTVCDQTDSTQTPAGPGPVGVGVGPFPQTPSEAGLMPKERGLHDAASQESTTSSFSGTPVKSAALFRPQAAAGTDNDASQTAPTPRTSLRTAPGCRKPGLTHSRHCCRAGGAPGTTTSRPGGGLEQGAVTPRVHTCKDLAELAAGLSHGDAGSMALAEAALRLQRRQGSVRRGGGAVPLTFDVSRVFTCCLPGLPEAASCVCAGFVTAVSAAGTPVPEDVQNRPLRVVLIEGDLTENYRHPGFNKPARAQTVSESAEPLQQDSAEELWADRVLQVLARFRVRLVLARGSVSERLVGRCARSKRLLIGWVDGRVLQAFAEASGAVQVAYVTQVNEDAVGSGVCVAFWSGPPGGAGDGVGRRAIVLKAEGVNLVTAVLTSPVAARLQTKEDGFWACARRLHHALQEQTVFLGGGALEFLCLGHLQVLAEQPVPKGDHVRPGGLPTAAAPRPAACPAPLRPTVLRGLASGWRQYLSTLARNAAGRSAAFEAETFIQRHVQRAADSGSPSSYVLDEYSRLSGGILNPGHSSRLDGGPRVYDTVTPKVEAWRRALDLVLLVLQTDSEIVTGRGRTQVRPQESEGFLLL